MIGWSLVVVVLAACVVVWNTMFVAWVANRFVDEGKAQIAGLFFTLGGFAYGAPARFSAQSDQIALMIGAVFGLAFICFTFFRRKSEHV